MLTKRIVNIVITRQASCIMHSIMQTFILVTIHCIMQIITALHLGQKEKEEQGQLTCLCEGIIKEKKRERERCVMYIHTDVCVLYYVRSVNIGVINTF